MLGFILFLIVVGIVAGYLARLLVPGRDPMSFVQTVVLGNAVRSSVAFSGTSSSMRTSRRAHSSPRASSGRSSVPWSPC